MDIMTPSKRNNYGISMAGGLKQFGTKSSTFGRMMGSELEKEGQGPVNNEVKRSMANSTYGTNKERSRKISMSRRANQDEKSEADSYGGESYDYDNEVSYYSSDEGDEEIKEKLEYDDGNDFTPEKPSKN